jgi:peptidoglycan/xylan/chitin deacetylase (PgdA/CDA1 family)
VREFLRQLRRPLSIAVRESMGTITHVATDEKVAALTFDDGPHAEYTPRLLDLLDRHQARATFFMLGEPAQLQPELVRRIAAAGHVIGNHSWDHPSFTLIRGTERRRQLRACARAIAPHGQRLFRPPFGEQNLPSHLDAAWLRYEVVTWSLEVGDWWDRDARHMRDLLVGNLKPGAVILLHDALRQHPCAARTPRLTRPPYADREPMLAALTMFLEQVGRQYDFVTIPELIRRGRPHRHHWYKTTPAAAGAS